MNIIRFISFKRVQVSHLNLEGQKASMNNLKQISYHVSRLPELLARMVLMLVSVRYTEENFSALQSFSGQR
jgi:hypothetical protein